MKCGQSLREYITNYRMKNLNLFLKGVLNRGKIIPIWDVVADDAIADRLKYINRM